MSSATSLSIVIPARNEAPALATAAAAASLYPAAEIVVVNDSSTDDTSTTCKVFGVREVALRHGMGNGAAVKSGARVATGDVIVFMDGDGQHAPGDIARLLELLDQGYDMAVGARSRRSQANVGRSFANGFYNRLASWMTNSTSSISPPVFAPCTPTSFVSSCTFCRTASRIRRRSRWRSAAQATLWATSRSRPRSGRQEPYPAAA
jgi:glycosyltransferase involved in cell wall biosynthesis